MDSASEDRRPRPDIGLGGYPDTTLEQARQRAREARELIRRGVDPRDERRKSREALAAADAARQRVAEKPNDDRARHGRF